MKINNAEPIEDLRKIGRIQDTEGTVSNIIQSIQPIIELNPKFTKFSKTCAVHTSTGTQVGHTLDSDKDFYLTYLHLSSVTTAAWDGTFIKIRYFSGSSTITLQFYQPTLTANNFNFYIDFPYPVRLDKGSTLATQHTFTAGAQSTNLTFGGFYLQ